MDNRSGNSQQLMPVDSPTAPQPQQPRQPSNLQGLLRFAVEATANEDVPVSSTMQPLSEERKRFLENAINSLSVNITKDLQDSINLLSDENKIKSIVIGEDIPTDIDDAFECIESHISSIDVAIGFYKLGGFSIFPVCLRCENSSVKSAACNLLAELCQNNPFCQSKVLECGYLETLVNMLTYEQDTQLLLKILYGISCIIRHHDPSTEAFLKLKDAYLGLKNVLQKPAPQLRAKASFIISYLYSDHKSIAGELVSSGVLKALIEALPKKHDNYSEQILSALCVLVTDLNKHIIMEMNNEQYNIKGALSDYLQSEDLRSENTDYFEEKQYCKTILETLNNQDFHKQKTAEADVDR